MPKPYHQDEVLKKILIKKKKTLVKPINMSIAPENDPVWLEIAKDLGNKITPRTVHSKAYTEGFRELVLNDKKNDGTEGSIESAAGSSKIHKGRKVSRESVLKIFFERKNEILRPKSIFVVAASNPVWASIATELGNVYSPKAIHDMAMNNQKYRNLLLPEAHRRMCRDRLKNKKTDVSPVKEENKDELRNEINAIISEDAVLKLVKTTDSLIADIRDLKNNQKLGKKILNEVRGLRIEILNEIRRLFTDMLKEKRLAR